MEYDEDDYPADLMEIVTDLISKLTAENGPCKANAQRVPPVVKFLTQFCDLWKPSEEKKETDEKEKEKMKKEFQSYSVDKKLLTGLFVSKGFNRNLPSGNKFTKTFTAILQALAKLHKPDFSDLVLPGRDEWNGIRIKAKFASELNNQKKEFSKNSTSGLGSGGTINVLKQRKRKSDGEENEFSLVDDKEKTVTLPWDMVQAGPYYFLRITAPYCNSQDIMSKAEYHEGKLIIKGMYTTSGKSVV